ncbi:hypothetical protein [Clavibacter capsici]|uniref:hypothetical protein n=1 Tax=Clavibacter capsici TaxID=1874630 RepID=UPI0014281D57|nr:hypothetical protein [Clavibacter capsici]QIS39072.1 hypothetical protein GW572_07365 [Clavibacter capsici]
MNTAPYVAAYRDYATAIDAAVQLTDPERTHEANLRHQATAITDARGVLTGATPAAPEPGADDRRAVLEALSPQNASDVALQGREREKVATLLQAGRPLPEIIAEASPLRVAAILDDWERLVQEDPSPQVAAAELRDAAFARLVALGEPDAVKVATAEAETAQLDAWSRVLTEAQGPAITLGSRQALKAADPERYREAFGDGLAIDHASIDRIETMTGRQ